MYKFYVKFGLKLSIYQFAFYFPCGIHVNIMLS